MSYLLLATVLLPLAAALVPLRRRETARLWTLGVTLVTFAMALVLAARFDAASGRFALVEGNWLGGLAAAMGAPVAAAPPDIRFSLALDGLSLWLFVLSGLLMITAVLVSWESVVEQAPLYYRLLLLLETGLLGVFSAQDIILFYVFFEFTLIPLFFIIGIWGSEERRYAAVKFFLFTLAGSLLTFLGLLAIVLWDAAHHPGAPLTFSIPELTAHLAASPMSRTMQIGIFLALFAGFAIKVPLFPFHTWLPLAHVQAPAAGSVLLAGVLLKVGTYGFARFSLPLLPEATAWAMPWMLWLSVAGILYGALVALAQSDMKRLIAYSSVSHLGFCMLGLFALTPVAVAGGTLQMINHGLSTGGLFALIGMIYERYHTRKIADFGGLARRLPRLTFFMLVMTFASIGLPGLNGFVGELMVLIGMFERGFTAPFDALGVQYRVIAVLAVFGVVLGAWYMLYLVERVFFGPLREPHAHGAGEGQSPRDLAPREIAALAPLVVVIVWIGVSPQFFLERMQPTLAKISAPAIRALQAGATAAGGASNDRDPAGENRSSVALHATADDVREIAARTLQIGAAQRREGTP